MVITVLCVIMVVLAVFLVIAVLMQSGKEPGLSGTIAGGAETFFGKNKGKTIDKALNTATMIVSIIFVAIVLFVYILQSADAKNKINPSSDTTAQETVTEEQTAEPEETDIIDTVDGETATQGTAADAAAPADGQTDAAQQSADAATAAGDQNG